MLRSETLPIYLDTYHFVDEVFRLTVCFAREYKFVLGKAMNAGVVELCGQILKINRSDNKAAGLNDFIWMTERVLLQIRLCGDLNLISRRRQMYLAQTLEEIRAQALAWQKAERRKTTQKY